MKRVKNNGTWHGQTPGKKNAATDAVLWMMAKLGEVTTVSSLRHYLGLQAGTITAGDGGDWLSGIPHPPVAQAVRRLRLAGLVRRADGGQGPGRAATYALTARGKKAAERAARSV